MTQPLKQAVQTIRTELHDSKEYQEIVRANFAQCVIRAAVQLPADIPFQDIEAIAKRSAEMALELLTLEF